MHAPTGRAGKKAELAPQRRVHLLPAQPVGMACMKRPASHPVWHERTPQKVSEHAPRALPPTHPPTLRCLWPCKPGYQSGLPAKQSNPPRNIPNCTHTHPPCSSRPSPQGCWGSSGPCAAARGSASAGSSSQSPPPAPARHQHGGWVGPVSSKVFKPRWRLSLGASSPQQASPPRNLLSAYVTSPEPHRTTRARPTRPAPCRPFEHPHTRGTTNHAQPPAPRQLRGQGGVVRRVGEDLKQAPPRAPLRHQARRGGHNTHETCISAAVRSPAGCHQGFLALQARVQQATGLYGQEALGSSSDSRNRSDGLRRMAVPKAFPERRRRRVSTPGAAVTQPALPNSHPARAASRHSTPSRRSRDAPSTLGWRRDAMRDASCCRLASTGLVGDSTTSAAAAMLLMDAAPCIRIFTATLVHFQRAR